MFTAEDAFAISFIFNIDEFVIILFTVVAASKEIVALTTVSFVSFSIGGSV
jgi:hypothetical protein